MLIVNKTQRGVTLVEAMIALLVVSIGLLGIASLQLTAMGQNTSALNHSKAVWIANNMADRIRANVCDVNDAPVYNGIHTDNGYSQDCKSNSCNQLQMVTADAADWADMVQTLPKGRGTVVFNNNVLTVTVMWDDDGTDANGETCNPQNANDLPCYRVAVAPRTTIPDPPVCP